MARLIDEYRPQTLGDVIGQAPIVSSLRAFLESPHSTAFLFTGPTGVGKTAAAVAIAHELGVDVSQHEFGGLHRIAAGEQTGDAVRALRHDLSLIPWHGSGWKVAVIDEADHVSSSAAQVWLSVLENLPARTVIIFTTNHPEKLKSRFKDRCEIFPFEASPLLMGPELQGRIDHIVLHRRILETAPRWEDLTDGRGDLSVRQVIQALDAWIRALPNGAA